MGQTEILKILEENPEKWFSVRELSERLGMKNGVGKSVKKLFFSGFAHKRNVRTIPKNGYANEYKLRQKSNKVKG